MKTVVFIRNGPSLRIYNQAQVLKQTNRYKSILICRTMDKDSYHLFSKVFDKIIFYLPSDYSRFRNRLDQIMKRLSMMYRIKKMISQFVDIPIERLIEQIKLSPLIKQGSPDAFNCLIRPYGLSHQVIKNSNLPIILDAYDFDGITHGIENLAKVVYKREKRCFERANGVIHRGPEFEIDYYRSHGYNITCPDLQFLDYCNKEFFVERNVKKLSSEDGEYHIAHIGGGLPTQFISLLKKAIKQKIHFHVYPTPGGITSRAFKDILKLNKAEKYVHLENRVPFDKVNREIAKYDFGAHIHLLPMSPISSMGLKVAHCHRFFNYLEAGLPIIVSDRLQLIKKTVVENKVGFSVKDEDFSNLRKMIEKNDYEELRENVFRAREKLLIDNHAKRLIKFYDEIIQKF